MKVVIFGASGMVGMGVLLECLDEPRVASVLVVGRSPCGVAHAKLREVLHRDFTDFTPLQADFRDADACFWCLGVTSAGMSEAAYRVVTHDYTVAAATALLASGARPVMAFVSGAGADSSERGRIMWARIKGMAENALLRLPFKAVYLFRPAMIQPLRGARSKTVMYRLFYAAFAPLTPLLRRLLPRGFTTTVDLGRAMIRVAIHGFERTVLGSRDINRAARLP